MHFGGGSAPTLPPATQSSAGVPDSKRVEINRLVTEHSPVLQDMTFVDKEIVGPAVLVPMDDQVSVIQSYLGIDADAVLWEIPVEREHLSGAIGLERCTFLRCRFINIGVGGPPEAMEHIRRTTPEGPNDALGARTQGQ